MSNLNLYQASGEESQDKKKMALLDSGFFWSLGLLFLVLVSFVGLKFFTGSLGAKVEELKNEIAKENAAFAGGDLDRVADFKIRMDESVKAVSVKRNSGELFSAVENSMIKGAYVNSIEQENGVEKNPILNIEMTAGDFSVIARQILSFKENSSFANVSVSDISRGEKGIEFKITAELK